MPWPCRVCEEIDGEQGVDLQKPRMRAVAEAVTALAAQPAGVQCRQLGAASTGAERTGDGELWAAPSGLRFKKLRGKSLVERIDKTRRYRVRRPAIRTLVALLDPTRAGDQTGLGRGVSAQARSSTQEPSSAR